MHDAMREIRISTIKVRDNVRQEDLDVDDLAASIRDRGLLQPVLVRRAPDGGYELVAGHRRLAAVKALGHETIQAMVHDGDDGDRLINQVTENVQRKQLRSYDIGLALRHLIKRNGWTIAEAAKAVSKSYPWVYQHLDYCDLYEDLQRAGVDRAQLARIPYDTMLELKHVPIDQQIELIRQIIPPDTAERCPGRFKVRRLIEAQRTRQRHPRPSARAAEYLVVCDELKVTAVCESMLQRRKVLQLLLEHGGVRG